MKALHSLKSAEKELFFTVATSDSGDSLPFLINLCYNLHCYSVISDFSCLHLMGRALYLSQEEATEENFDNTAFFMKSIEDGKFKITEKAKENGLNPYEYLVYVLKTAPNLDQEKVNWAEELLPWNAPESCRVPL